MPLTRLEMIQKQFRDGMAWNNYGRLWHVDHIKPCSAFNLLDLEEQRKCFHYTNLQPLLAHDNLSKGRNFEDSLVTAF